MTEGTHLVDPEQLLLSIPCSSSPRIAARHYTSCGSPTAQLSKAARLIERVRAQHTQYRIARPTLHAAEAHRAQLASMDTGAGTPWSMECRACTPAVGTGCGMRVEWVETGECLRYRMCPCVSKTKRGYPHINSHTVCFVHFSQRTTLVLVLARASGRGLWPL